MPAIAPPLNPFFGGFSGVVGVVGVSGVAGVSGFVGVSGSTGISFQAALIVEPTLIVTDSPASCLTPSTIQPSNCLPSGAVKVHSGSTT